ncbi:hypothetical protein BHE74_00020158 [Ensete ventricosum]|nr:hypothetical protein BHE74_00020158 [Ensete ventricosum]
MKRARGSSGRFLNTKQLQQQKQTQISAIPGCQDHSGSKLCSGSGFIGSSAPSINSDIRTASTNGSMLTQQDHLSFPFPDFHSNVGVGTQGGHTMMGGVVQSFNLMHSGTQKATSQRRPVPGISQRSPCPPSQLQDLPQQEQFHHLPVLVTRVMKAKMREGREGDTCLSYLCHEGKDERREGGKEIALPEEKRMGSKIKQENLVIVSTVFLSFSSIAYWLS